MGLCKHQTGKINELYLLLINYQILVATWTQEFGNISPMFSKTHYTVCFSCLAVPGVS